MILQLYLLPFRLVFLHNSNLSSFKEVVDFKGKYGKPIYNMNAPKYKPNLLRTDTEIVEEDMETDNYEILQESDISSSSHQHRNSSNSSFASVTAGVITSLIKKTQEVSLQQPFEFVDENNKTILSYIDNIFSCEGGFYSIDQITVCQTPGLGWYILLTILLTAVFVIIIDSY
jgi:hypothetical protein